MSLLKNSESYHAYFVNKRKALLKSSASVGEANRKNCAGAKLNADIVGETSSMDRRTSLASQFQKEPISLAAECKEVGERTVDSWKVITSHHVWNLKAVKTELTKLAKWLNSTVLATQQPSILLMKNWPKFGIAVKAIRVICNSPSTFGGIGDVYTPSAIIDTWMWFLRNATLLGTMLVPSTSWISKSRTPEK